MKRIFFILFLLCFDFSFGKNLIEDVKIKTDDGWILNAKWHSPLGRRPILLFIHSQKNNLTEWKKWMPVAEKYGFGYLAIDLRGHGLSNISPDGSTTTFKSFSVNGLDNEYNKMIRDVDAALVWISSQGFTMDRVVPVGSWLGANLAVKITAINKEIPMCVAIYPSMNINDVLIVNPLRAYGKRPILIVSSSRYEKKYKEFQLLNDIARLSCGKENVFSIVEENIDGPSDLKISAIARILGWTENPKIPEIIDYNPTLSTQTVSSSTIAYGENNEQK